MYKSLRASTKSVVAMRAGTRIYDRIIQEEIGGVPSSGMSILIYITSGNCSNKSPSVVCSAYREIWSIRGYYGLLLYVDYILFVRLISVIPRLTLRGH